LRTVASNQNQTNRKLPTKYFAIVYNLVLTTREEVLLENLTFVQVTLKFQYNFLEDETMCTL